MLTSRPRIIALPPVSMHRSVLGVTCIVWREARRERHSDVVGSPTPSFLPSAFCFAGQTITCCPCNRGKYSAQGRSTLMTVCWCQHPALLTWLRNPSPSAPTTSRLYHPASKTFNAPPHHIYLDFISPCLEKVRKVRCAGVDCRDSPPYFEKWEVDFPLDWQEFLILAEGC